jgi:spore coat polysaccharide biosynthesis protein SpsF (cytidylyltransferase family)
VDTAGAGVTLATGDAFEVNGRFACVVHAGKTKAIIRVMNDDVPYTVARALAETLVKAFRSDPSRVQVV